MLIATAVPVYNEGERLAAFLDDWVAEALNRPCPVATLIVVDDGSAPSLQETQRAAAAAAAATLRRAGSPHRIEYRRSPDNRGKGASIRLAWSLADAGADWLGFIDSDGAVPAREYWRLAEQLPACSGDALCGSRVRMAGRSVKRSVARHVQGRTFAALVEQLFHLGCYDTQCGLKFFRASRLRPLVSGLREDRWLLDVEVLSLLARAGGRLVEAPIDCHERGGSSLVFGVDPLRMALRLVRLRARFNQENGNRR